MGNDSIANAVGLGPVLTIEFEGEEYTLAPLLMEEMGEVELFVNEKHKKESLAFIKDLGDLVTAEERLDMIKELRNDISGNPERDDDGKILGWVWLEEVRSPTVMALIIRKRLKKANPDLTDEEARNMITLQAIADIDAEMSELLGLDAFQDAVLGDDAQGEAESG